MNTNGSRNWLLWLAIILGLAAVVYVVRNRMQKPAMQEVVVVEDVSPETNVDAQIEVEQVEQAEVAE